MTTITIMRALPGAGKSTAANVIATTTGAQIHSADSFPGLYPGRDEAGRLTIDVTKMGPAHGACMRGAAEDVRAGRSVVIDNTNLSVNEMLFYIGLAQAYGAAPVIVDVECDPRVAFERNTHGVPFAVIRTAEGAIRKTFAWGEGAGEGETIVGGFVTMMDRAEAFKPEFHWRFIPGYDRQTV